jgi:hypothetical protein
VREYFPIYTVCTHLPLPETWLTANALHQKKSRLHLCSRKQVSGPTLYSCHHWQKGSRKTGTSISLHYCAKIRDRPGEQCGNHQSVSQTAVCRETYFVAGTGLGGYIVENRPGLHYAGQAHGLQSSTAGLQINRLCKKLPDIL